MRYQGSFYLFLLDAGSVMVTQYGNDTNDMILLFRFLKGRVD